MDIHPLRLELRHPISGLSHLLAAVSAFFGFLWLLYLAINFGTAWHIFSFAIFGTTMILVFSSSAIYHLASGSDRLIGVLRKIDHMMIYIFIAGSYTPVCLLSLRESLGIKLVIGVWVFAVLGCIKKLYWIHAPRWLGVGTYVLMTLFALAAVPDMMRVMPDYQLKLILAEVILYGIGAGVYLVKWPNLYPKVFGFHELWHFFVVGGSTCHFILVSSLI